MSSAIKPKPSGRNVPLLVAGERLNQKTFHERYVLMPENVKAELVEGIVYMAASALKLAHGGRHSKIHYWLESYCEETPGTDAFDNITAILGEESEPQPDAILMVLPDYGGRSRVSKDGYCDGAPELTVEVSLSTESVDRNAKLRDYQRAGVMEYLIVLVQHEQIIWYSRPDANRDFVELKPDQHGILKSNFFGGLWLDPVALFAGDRAALRATLKRGFASAEHAAFVKSLARRKK